MAEQNTPKFPLRRGWALGETGWDVGDDQTRLVMDFALHRTVKSIVGALPGSGMVAGDAYILNASAGADAHKLAFWAVDRANVGSWLKIVPLKGWEFRVEDNLNYFSLPTSYVFDGSAWVEEDVGQGGGGGGGTVVTGTISSGTLNLSAVTADTVKVALNANISTLTLPAGAAGVRKDLVIEFTHDNTATVYTVASGGITWEGGSATAIINTANAKTYWMLSNVDNGGWVGFPDQVGSGGGGGLTNLTEAKNTSTPNTSTPVVSLSISITESSGDVALVAKGSGATTAQVADNATAGGNKRGTYATDWQKIRTAAAKVASGTYSVIGGGFDNAATGSYSVISGGEANSASTHAAVGGGQSNQATGQYSSVLGGYANTAIGTSSSICGGEQNTADGAYSTVLGGTQGNARGIVGVEIRANGMFAASGDAQRRRMIVRRSTTDATQTAATSNGTTATTNNQFYMENNSAHAFRATVVARQNSTGNAAAWRIEGLIKRGANAAATAVVGTPIKTLIAADSGASTWDITAEADTINGALTIKVTGAAGVTARWVGDLQAVEVVG